jgi:pimeloyl-ACP methyl ester carboxylesterase
VDAPPAVRGGVEHHGHRIAYEIRGEGPRTVVLLHGLLLPAHVNGPLAAALAARGYRVVLPELLGHGRSDGPISPALHRVDLAGEQVLTVLDHLGLDDVVVGGMSLGANVSLELATRAPERFAGIICEMPVLERGAVAVLLQLAPLWVTFVALQVPVRALFDLIGRLPRTRNDVIDAVLDTAQDPKVMAAVLHGYAAGPTAPPRPAREAIELPALVIGHGHDWIHPLDDAVRLVRELPNARLLEAAHLLDLRLRPERFVDDVVAFLEEVWQEPAAELPA